MKALIIDDEIDICYLLSSILKNKNLHPNCVNSLSAATLALQKEVPELIFLDNHLPDGLGIEYITHIKKNCPNTKVIMITAHDNVEDRRKALAVGVDSFIGKPFTRDIIYRAIDQLLNSI